MLSGNFNLITLNAGDLPALLALQKKINDEPETKYFLRKRSDDAWANILSNPDFVVFGIFDKERLIASATVHFPNGQDAREIPEYSPAPDNEIAVFQAVMVDFDYRGQGIMYSLQEARKFATMRRKRSKIICKISADNFSSWKNTINYGFHCTEVAKDETGRYKMYFVKKVKLEQGFFSK